MYNNFHVLHDIILQKEQIFLKLQCSTSFVHNNKNFQKSEYSQFIKKKFFGKQQKPIFVEAQFDFDNNNYLSNNSINQKCVLNINEENHNFRQYLAASTPSYL